MKIAKTKTLNSKQYHQINQLWNDEYPIKLRDRFPILLEGATNYHHYVIEDSKQHVIAWAVDFEKENQIRFSIIVSSSQQGKGLGGLLINKLKAEHKEFYGWVIDHNDDVKSNGERYQTPLPFYLKHGFEILHEERIESEMIRAVKVKYQLATT
jgi:hypothetical protein